MLKRYLYIYIYTYGVNDIFKIKNLYNQTYMYMY